MNFSTAALSAIRDLIDGEPDCSGLRLCCQQAGCAGLIFSWSFLYRDTILVLDGLAMEPDYVIVWGHELDALVEDLSVDYEDTPLGSRWIWDLGTPACGCHKSLAIPSHLVFHEGKLIPR